MSEQIYKVRFFAEPWNKPKASKVREVMPGVSVCEDNFGYTDVLFAASILHDEKGKISSILLMSSEDGPVSRKVLEAVRDQIDHHLTYHTEDYLDHG